MSRHLWQWRPTPPDQGQDFGNANVFATPPTLDTLIRETGQNSLDAVVDENCVYMRYKIIEISKENPAYQLFFESVGLDDVIKHVSAASEHRQKIGARLRSGLENFKSGDRLVLLRIDDYGTTGLFGPESPRLKDEHNPYYSLIRNNLDTSKPTSTAGGSYGLGKAVNWAMSALQTVVVASEIHPSRLLGWEPGQFRVSGKSELTWHQVGSKSFAGPGWLARPGTDYESMWVEREGLQPMQLDRTQIPFNLDPYLRSGTSLLIIGFRGDLDRHNPQTAVDEIASAVSRNFWPAILQNQLKVYAEHEVDGKIVSGIEVNPRFHVPAFCEAYEKYLKSEVSTGDEPAPGEIVVRKLPLTLMRTRPEQRDVEPLAQKVDGETHLVTRITSRDYSGPDSSLIDHVALIRGRLMVVRYLAKRNILVGGQSFHGLLLAGTAAKDAKYAKNTEEFLRAAEPPAHDKWEHSRDLESVYHLGTGQRLKEFFDGITEELRKILRPPRGDDTQGPTELRRMLQSTYSGSPGSIPKPTVHKLRAKLDYTHGQWRVSGEIGAPSQLLPLHVFPKLSLMVESGRSIPLAWEEFSSPDGLLVEGAGILVDKANRKIRFEGLSAKAAAGVPAGGSKLEFSVNWNAVESDGKN